MRLARGLTRVRQLNKAQWFRHVFGGVITLLCLFVLFHQVDVKETLAALAGFQASYLLFGVVSLASGYALRIARWSMMLRATGSTVTFSDCSAPFLGSIALNNILPLRLGDVVRALVFPKSLGISKATATSSIIIERLVDLMALLACLAIGLFAVQSIEVPIDLKRTAVSLASAGGIVLVVGLLFSGAIARFLIGIAANRKQAGSSVYAWYLAALGSLLHGFDVMLRPALLIALLAISMLIWIAEAGLFYFVLLGAGVDASILSALLVMALATLSTLVPSSPGYVGPFHLAAFTAVSMLGAASAQAGSSAVIVHLALWVPTTIAGALAIWLRPELFRTAKQLDT